MPKPPAGMIRMNVNVDEEIHSRFKALAALEGKKMSELLIEFMEDYVKQHMPPGFLRKAGKK